MTPARPYLMLILHLLAGLSSGAGSRADAAAPERGSAGLRATVIDETAIAYERPDVLANALRLLYLGEVLVVEEMLLDAAGARWARMRMGSLVGYVKGSALGLGDSLAARAWRPEVIPRDARPLSFSLRGGAEMFGYGLALRYNAFTRLGFAFSVGSIVDWPEMNGTSLGFGIVSHLALGSFSPLIETGFVRLSYHEDYATLRVNSYFLSVGVEWMSGIGVVAALMVTYIRSADVEVAFDYLNAKAGQTQVPPDFGILDPGGDNTFQFLLPGFSLGYAF